jgi:hypothetical protein
VSNQEVSKRSRDAIVGREAHLTTNPRIVVVLLAKLKVNLERLNLKNSVSQSQGRGSSEVTRGIFNDVISANLLKGGFEVYVWKDFNKSFVQSVSRQKRSRDVLARKLTCIVCCD